MALCTGKVRRSRWPILVMAPVPSARTVLSRRDPDPGGKFPAVPEVRHVRYIGGQRKRRDRSDTGNRHQTPSGFQCLHVGPDPSLQLLDDLVHVIHRREQRLQREMRRLGHRAVVILDHLSQATDVRLALGGRHAVLRQRTADRIRQLRALPNQQAPGPKQGRLRLRRGALHRHRANRRRLVRLVLLPLDERLDVMRRQQLHRVTELGGFHAPSDANRRRLPTPRCRVPASSGTSATRRACMSCEVPGGRWHRHRAGRNWIWRCQHQLSYNLSCGLSPLALRARLKLGHIMIPH